MTVKKLSARLGLLRTSRFSSKRTKPPRGGPPSSSAFFKKGFVPLPIILRKLLSHLSAAELKTGSLSTTVALRVTASGTTRERSRITTRRSRLKPDFAIALGIGEQRNRRSNGTENSLKLPRLTPDRSPKFIMGGSAEDKFDHPTQKPLELMRRPILSSHDLRHRHRDDVEHTPTRIASINTAIRRVLSHGCCARAAASAPRAAFHLVLCSEKSPGSSNNRKIP